ncbi:unnamed protein product [Prorocentrum cordatum]|uniref:Glycoside hydrolase family 5 domain-containing protein n=1 Tax=Prorocentrum cordatum TaxID=2364126 RepID=A0ABN9TGL3_9DINO|nr:unnamed protein product [Polarella glacialis]
MSDPLIWQPDAAVYSVAVLAQASSIGFARSFHYGGTDTAMSRTAQPSLGFRVGCNYVPSDASNQLDMWRRDSFNPALNDVELGWAREKLGMSLVRVFLHEQPFFEDPCGFLDRVEQFLQIADSHGIQVMFVIWDGCWRPSSPCEVEEQGADGKLRRVGRPLIGVHNSCWVQSPLLETLRAWHDRSRLHQDDLRHYVQTVVRRFRTDPRIHSWDLYNEADNWVLEMATFLSNPRRMLMYIADSLRGFAWRVCAGVLRRKSRSGGAGRSARGDVHQIVAEHEEQRLSSQTPYPHVTWWTTSSFDLDLRFALLASTVLWVRSVAPSQPVTICEWEMMTGRFCELALRHSDIGSFHIYSSGRSTAAEAERMQVRYGVGRQVFLTEYLARPWWCGSRFDTVLPALKQRNVAGALNWGLVAGRTQTFHSWLTWFWPLRVWGGLLAAVAGAASLEPRNWWHDVLRPGSGEPYRQDEAALLRLVAGQG